MAATKVTRHETRKYVRPLPVEERKQAAIHTYEDELAVEEPLEIHIHNQPVTMLLRTPGDDYDLVAGFLYTEGIIRNDRDLGTIRHTPSPDNPDIRDNIINVTFAEGYKYDLSQMSRHHYAGGGGGVTAKGMIEAFASRVQPVDAEVKVPIPTLYDLAAGLRRAQTHADRMGGLNAAALFDRRGTLRMFREDVGRHNSVDKSFGAMLLQSVESLADDILLLSGRASYEIVRKAVVARIPMIGCSGTPSSMAVELAREFGVTIIVFSGSGEMNVYTHPERIQV
jgi:FdhD protein